MYIRFKQKNFKTWIRNVSTEMGLKPKNNLLSLPADHASGFCFADSIDRSFSFIIMNMELKENCTLHRISNNQLGLVIFFNQIEVEDYLGLRIRKNSLLDNRIKQRNNIFLSSSNTELEVTFTAGTKLKRLGIYLSPQWLSENFDSATKLQIEQITKLDLQLVNTLLINEEMQERLTQIFETDFQCEAAKLTLKTRVILLLEYLFHTFFSESLEIRNKKIIPDHDLIRLQTVETLLADEETAEFPSINQLARIAQMSSTKLKQRFKQVYGYRLYEFYNKQRLGKAKELIEQGSTLKEAGQAIGFADVSNFTKAFKKEFGHTPGAFTGKTR